MFSYQRDFRWPIALRGSGGRGYQNPRFQPFMPSAAYVLLIIVEMTPAPLTLLHYLCILANK